jgi:hypothetical protein
MKWDAERRVYVDEQGQVVTAKQLREYVDAYIDAEQVEVAEQVAALRAGELTVEEFFGYLEEKIIAMHGTSAIIAYGGEGEMNADRWHDVGTRIHSELEYLDGFKKEASDAYAASESIASDVASAVGRNPEVADVLDDKVRDRVLGAILENSVTDVEGAIAEAITEIIGESVDATTVDAITSGVLEDVIDPASQRLEELIWGSVENRSSLYLEAPYATYENSVLDRESEAGAVGVRRVSEEDSSVCEGCDAESSEEYVSLDEVADIGSQECGNSCRCYFEFSFLGVDQLSTDEALIIEGEAFAGTE